MPTGDLPSSLPHFSQEVTGGAFVVYDPGPHSSLTPLLEKELVELKARAATVEETLNKTERVVDNLIAKALELNKELEVYKAYEAEHTRVLAVKIAPTTTLPVNRGEVKASKVLSVDGDLRYVVVVRAALRSSGLQITRDDLEDLTTKHGICCAVIHVDPGEEVTILELAQPWQK